VKTLEELSFKADEKLYLLKNGDTSSTSFPN